MSYNYNSLLGKMMLGKKGRGKDPATKQGMLSSSRLFVAASVLSLFGAGNAMAQQKHDLIPVDDGAFKQSTFAANGWTVANEGTGQIKWAVGSAVASTKAVGGTTTNSTSVTLTAANPNIAVGQLVYGDNIPANTTVNAISTDGLTLTLSQNVVLGATSQELGFGSFYAGTGGASITTTQATTVGPFTPGTFTISIPAANPNISVGMLVNAVSGFIGSNTYVASISNSGKTIGLSSKTINTANVATAQTLTFLSTTSAINGNAAYISYDNGLTNSFATNSTNRTVYFYRDITPASSSETAMTLTFDVKSAPAGSTGGWQVWVAPITQTVTGTNTLVTSPGSYSAATAWPGATLISFNVDPQVATTRNTAFIPKSFAGAPFRLIFAWVNTSSAGAAPPAAIDNISLTSRMPNTDGITCAHAGLWSQPGTWTGNTVPTPADVVVLDNDLESVMIDSRFSGCQDLFLAGTNTLTQFAFSSQVDEFNIYNDLGLQATNARFNNHDGIAGKIVRVGHNIDVLAGARFDSTIGSTSTGAGKLALNGATPQTVTIDPAAIIGGDVSAGVNASTNTSAMMFWLEVTNTSAITPNITWNADGIRIGGKLDLTTGRVSVSSGKRFIIGNFFSLGSSNFNIAPGAGFVSGKVSKVIDGKYSKVVPPGSDSPISDSTIKPFWYPFITAAGSDRSMYLLPDGVGLPAEVAITYNDANNVTGGLNVPDGAYSINNRYEGNWAVSTPDSNVVPAGAPLIYTPNYVYLSTTATGMPALTTTVTFGGTTGAVVGQSVSGPNIAANTYVTAVTNTTITLSQATTNTAAITAAVRLFFTNALLTTDTGMPATTTVVTLASTNPNVLSGMPVTGPNIAPNTYVKSIIGTTLTLTQPTTNSSAISTAVRLTFTPSFRLSATAVGAYQTKDGSSRLMNQNAVLPGVHQDGTTLPFAFRKGLTLADLTANPIYMGIGNASIINASAGFTSKATGDWNATSTWVGGVVPTCNDVATIASGHNVTVTGAATAAGVIINQGGTLTNNSGTNTMTVGSCANSTYNAAFVNYGTHTMTAGNLKVNGYVAHKLGSFFNQTGGEIIIDSNSGDAATSVGFGGSSCKIETANLALTGGKITIVDPLVNLPSSSITSATAVGQYQVKTVGATGTFGYAVNAAAAGASTIVVTFPVSASNYFYNTQVVSGTGIAAGTTITNVATSGLGPVNVTLTLSANVTSAIAANTVLQFSSMVNGSKVVVVESSTTNALAANLSVGHAVSGNIVPTGTTVSAVSAGPTAADPIAVTLSNAVANASQTQETLTFNALAIGGSALVLTAVNADLQPNQIVTGAGIKAGTFITGVSGNKITLSDGIVSNQEPFTIDVYPDTAVASGAFVYTGPKNYATGVDHTLQIGDGVSSQKGAVVTNGFNCAFQGPGGMISIGNLIVNGPDGDNRPMTVNNLGGSSTSFGSMNVQNQLTINSGGTLKKINGGNSTFYVGGNIVNNGSFLQPSNASLLYLGNFINGVAVPTTLPQTISGNGTWLSNQWATTPGLLTGFVNQLTVNNTSTQGVTLQVANFRAGGAVALTNGILHTSAAYPLNVGNPDVSLSGGTFSGGKATSYIDGPCALASQTSTTLSSYRLIPLGKNGKFLPISIATIGGVELMAEAFDTNSGTVNSANATNVSASRWKLSRVGTAGTFSNYSVKIGDISTPVTASNIIVQAPADQGTYDIIPVTPAILSVFDGTGTYNTLTAAISTTQATALIPATSTAVTLSAPNSSIAVGMNVTGTNIAANTTVAAINGTALTLSQNSTNATAVTSAITLTFAYASAVYPTGASFTGNFAYATRGAACSGTPAPGATVAKDAVGNVSTSACGGQGLTLSLANATAGSNVAYQWQSSLNDGTTWTDITGATAATYVANPSVDTSYRANVTCSGSTGASTLVKVTTSASGVTTTPATICTPGTAALTASGSSILTWYDAQAVGNFVASGPSFSPTVATTTTYYVASGSATAGTAVNSGAFTGTTANAYNTLNTGIAFDANKAIRLNKVTVYPLNNAAGVVPVTVALFDSTGNLVPGTTPVTFTPTTTVTFGTTSQDVTLNYIVPVGKSYRLAVTNGLYGLTTNTAYNMLGASTRAITFPTANGPLVMTGNISGGTINGSVSTAANTTTYFHNLQFDEICESVRVPVVATVVNTPAPTATAQSFCGSATVADLKATGTSIKWYLAATGGQALDPATALSSTTYYASQTANSCESLPRTAVVVTMGIADAPTAVATQDACATGTIADFVVTGATGATFTWYDAATAGNVLATTTKVVLNTTYYVSQTVNGCEGPRVAVKGAGPCLPTQEFKIAELHYYPNPVSDHLTISANDTISRVEVYDLLGRQLKVLNADTNSIRIDLHMFETSTYLVKVYSGNKTELFKVVKK